MHGLHSVGRQHRQFQASAPIIAVAYNPNYAGIGVLMGIFGQAIGNFFGLGMGWLLNLMA